MTRGALPPAGFAQRPRLRSRGVPRVAMAASLLCLAYVARHLGMAFCGTSLNAMAPKLSGRVAVTAAAPAVVDAPITDIEEAAERRREERRANATKSNASLELSSGFPSDFDREVTQGPPWATCFVQFEDRSARADDGTVLPRTVLEEWVMRGEEGHIRAFHGWQLARAAAASIRCVRVPQAAVEETKCLECISHGGLLEAQLGTYHASGTSDFVLTFGVHQCLATSLGRGYCKKGMVAF
eukprot:CAMPEP_0117503940 /NCGR_PEP_ID=MMETSP0784-20121206/24591_1 /TAXON_ID=39447 /ORGANISM="" /LENGTH=239 /DNA_ID=CAMNT_0005299277 /DNA_START=110 /DNA_END=829 /DNA_ORIENTATION=-